MKTYLQSGLVSAAVGLAVALVVHYAVFRPADAGRGQIPADEPAAKKTAVAGEDWARVRKDVQALRAEVAAARESSKANEEKLQALERAAEEAARKKPAGGSEAETDAARNAVKKLLEIRDPSRQSAIQKVIEAILEHGDEAVPFLAEALASGDDCLYAGNFSVSGNSITEYASLRSALIEALCQIGTQQAKQAILETLRNPQTPHEVEAALILYRETRDSMMIQGMAASLPGTLERMARGELKGLPERSHFHAFLAEAVRNWGLVSDRAFTQRLTAVAGIMKGKDRGFPDVLGLVVDASPEDAARLVREKHESDEKASYEDLVALVGFRSANRLNLAQYVRFLRTLMTGHALTERDRASIWGRAGAIAVSRRNREEDRDAIRDFCALLRERRGAEGDPSVQRAIDEALGQIEGGNR
jgi:hypothetical protein